jgi:hypothetical protein
VTRVKKKATATVRLRRAINGVLPKVDDFEITELHDEAAIAVNDRRQSRRSAY